MLGNSIRLLLAMALVSAVVYGGIVVDRWHRDSVMLQTIGPAADRLADENSAMAAQVSALATDKAELKRQIDSTNHAIALAKAAADNATALQEQARTYAAKEQQRSTRRIAELERDLADTNKTLTDMFDNSWRQPR